MMSRTTSRRRWTALVRLFTVVFCLFLLPFTSSAQPGDEAALRRLAEQFFAAYEKKDMNAILPLWSNKSPNLAAAKQNMEHTFSSNNLELKGLTVGRITVGDGKASVRVFADMSGVDVKTGKAAINSGKMNRTLDCVREGEIWKIWRYVSSEDDLAAALVSANTDEQRKALLANEKDLWTSDLIKAMLAQARRLFDQASYSRVLEVVDLAGDLARQLGDKKLSAAVFGFKGAVNLVKSNYSEALHYFEESVRLAEEVSDKPQIANGINNLGIICRIQGNYTQALEYYQRALKVREEVGDKSAVAETLNNIGLVYQSQGNYTRALDYYRRRLEIKEGVGDKNGISNTLSNIGVVHRLQGRYIQAMEYFERSLRLSEQTGDKRGIAAGLSNIGGIHQMQGNGAQALEHYKQSQKIYEEIGSKSGMAMNLLKIGIVSAAQGKLNEALEYFQASMKINQDVGDKGGSAAIQEATGQVLTATGEYSRALEAFQKALEIREETGDKGGIAMTLLDLARCYVMQNNHAAAVETANRAAAISKEIGSPEVFLQSRAIAGEGYRRLSQREPARQAVSEAILALEDLRDQVTGDEQQQLQFLENRLTPFYQMIALLIGEKNFTEALVYAERAKARTLVDVLQKGRAGITRAMTSGEQEQELRLKSEVVSSNIQSQREKQQRTPSQVRLAELDARLQKARLNYEAFQINLYAAHPELKVHRGQSQPLSLDQAGMLIPDGGTALLEYVVSQDGIYLFVLTGEHNSKRKDNSSHSPSLRVYALNITAHDLAERVERFRHRVATLDFGIEESARDLYDLLLAPASAELQHKTNLIIVPDGVLWELPFQALQPSPKRFLIEDSAVSYAPSLTVLQEMTRAHSTTANTSPRILAFGNPAVGKQTTQRINSVFMDERLEPLPEAERQVRELAKLYGPARSRIYIGPEAQEARVKAEAGSYGILHLAAHGILNDKSPMYSQIVLSQLEGDTNEDGMLEAWEIMKLDLKADLVVLSACDTARGRIGGGEGMIGLTWAFFVAGVPTTVASQWSVDSASTTELMVEFHRNLERHQSTAESLRQAMLKLLKSKEYNRPFYWAGFVVVGNGR